MSGNRPKIKSAATRMKTGMSRRLDSLRDVSSLGFFEYMTFMRRKMYAVCSTLVKTPMTASQAKFA